MNKELTLRILQQMIQVTQLTQEIILRYAKKILKHLQEAFISMEQHHAIKEKNLRLKFNIPQSILDNPGSLIVETEDPTLSVESFTQDGAFAVIEFKDERVYNISTSPETDLNSSDSFRIRLPPTGTEDKQYDYSKLGETWSTPRIIRLPVDEDPANDIYTAVLPGGLDKRMA